MKVHELLIDETKWTQGQMAMDSDRIICSFSDHSIF